MTRRGAKKPLLKPLLNAFITAAEAAAICGVGADEFLAWVGRRLKGLPPTVDRRRLLYDREDMQTWAAGRMSRPGKRGRKTGSLMAKTTDLIDAVRDVLEEHRPQTIWQCFYRLVSRNLIGNTNNNYVQLQEIIATARTSDLIPWDWIEDRLRQPIEVPMWRNPADFAATVIPQYRADVWPEQPVYVEVFLEKQALARIFEEELAPYGVILNVNRGFVGWGSNVEQAAQRYRGRAGRTAVFYFGDYDPSGMAMPRILQEALAWFGVKYGWWDCAPEITVVAITREDIERYRLPPNRLKTDKATGEYTDPRAEGFITETGRAESVELDALPVDVLQARIVEAVEDRMDMDALKRTLARDKRDRARLARVFKGRQKG